MNHLALVLLLPAAWLTWRWSRLVSGALWATLAVWLAYEAAKWQWPYVWTTGRLEWMRGVSMVTGLVGAVCLVEHGRHPLYLVGHGRNYRLGFFEGMRRSRATILAALLVASMGVDLTAWLIHRGAGQWGPQPVFQVGVLLAMCAISVWPRRKS